MTKKPIKLSATKTLIIVAKHLYQVGRVKSTIEHHEPMIVGVFILKYAKLRILDQYYNFFDKLCDVNKIEELEILQIPSN